MGRPLHVTAAMALAGLAAFTSPVVAQGAADYYPIERGGGSTAYGYSDRGLQLTPKKTVTACIHARNAPVVSFPMEGGSSGSAYCMEGKVISFHLSNGKTKMCTITYSIRGLSVSNTTLECVEESVTQFSEDGHIVSCRTGAPAITPAATDNGFVCASMMRALEIKAKTSVSPGCTGRAEFVVPFTYQENHCVGAHKFFSRCSSDNIERPTLEWYSRDNPGKVHIDAIRQQYEREFPNLRWR